MRILLVDDSPGSLKLLETVIKKSRPQCYIFTASNGEEALKQLGLKKIDLVISDYRMPILGGDGLAGAMKRHHPTINLGFVTGMRSEEVDESLNELNPVFVLHKPFTAIDINNALLLVENSKSEKSF